MDESHRLTLIEQSRAAAIARAQTQYERKVAAGAEPCRALKWHQSTIDEIHLLFDRKKIANSALFLQEYAAIKSLAAEFNQLIHVERNRKDQVLSHAKAIYERAKKKPEHIRQTALEQARQVRQQADVLYYKSLADAFDPNITPFNKDDFNIHKTPVIQEHRAQFDATRENADKIYEQTMRPAAKKWQETRITVEAQWNITCNKVSASYVRRFKKIEDTIMRILETHLGYSQATRKEILIELTAMKFTQLMRTQSCYRNTLARAAATSFPPTDHDGVISNTSQCDLAGVVAPVAYRATNGLSLFFSDSKEKPTNQANATISLESNG